MHNIDNFSKSHKKRTPASLAILLIAFPVFAHPGSEKNGVGTRSMGLANAYVAIANDPWAAFYNPAGLAHVSSIQASAFCSPAQFGMDELRTMSIGATLPLSILTGSIAIDQFGYDLYRETSVALAFGASANEWISLGLTTHFTRLAIRGYGTTSQMVFDVGGIATVFDGVSMGWCWKNFTRTSVGAQSGQIPQILSMGACYEITEDSRLVVELEKELHYPIVRKFGYEQRLLAFLSVRLGISDNPDKFSCGLGLSAAGFEFSYAGYSHPQLGWTHQVEISVSLSQKPEAE